MNVKEVKKEIVKKVNDLYTNNDYVVVVDFKGLNAEDTSALRCDLVTKCGCKFLVIKNTLNKIAAKGTDFESNIDFKGQCGVIFCNDLFSVAKVLKDFCFKDNKVKFVSCLNRGSAIASEQIKELAFLSSVEELRAKLLYTLNAVGTSLVRIMAERVKKQQGDEQCSE